MEAKSRKIAEFCGTSLHAEFNTSLTYRINETLKGLRVNRMCDWCIDRTACIN
jgi:hypothetical protein